MKFAKPLTVSLATLGLMAAPIAAQAAPVRTASSVKHGEELTGGGAILYVALAAMAIAAGILILGDNNDVPTSP